MASLPGRRGAVGETVYVDGNRYVADHTGTFFRYCKPTGTRVSLTLPPGFAAALERSPQVARVMQAQVTAIATLADQTCPVGDTGTLKASQVSEVRITPAGVVGIIAYMAFYAHMVHNGTVKRAADPWLLNAALSVMAGRQSVAA